MAATSLPMSIYIPYRVPDDALGLIQLAGEALSVGRCGKNTRHLLPGFQRQSVFSRLVEYDDVNNPEYFSKDSVVMPTIVDNKSPDQMAA